MAFSPTRNRGIRAGAPNNAAGTTSATTGNGKRSMVRSAGCNVARCVTVQDCLYDDGSFEKESIEEHKEGLFGGLPANPPIALLRRCRAL
jgi:hypothetical protein